MQACDLICRLLEERGFFSPASTRQLKGALSSKGPKGRPIMSPREGTRCQLRGQRGPVEESAAIHESNPPFGLRIFQSQPSARERGASFVA